MHFKPVLFLAAALVLVPGAQAQSAAAGSATAKASVAAEFTEGEVRKVDKEGKKITLKHGEIKSLGMPPMAMVFQVSDPSFLDKVKAGDKVRFKAAHQSGKYVVTEIQLAK